MNAPAYQPDGFQLKLPPHSIESEQSVIGGLMLDNSAWDRVGDVLSEADFYRDDHRRIFRHISRLIEVGRPADVVTVFEAIEKSNEVDQTGGLAYLGEIANNTPSAANIRRYAEIVHERAIMRNLLTVGDQIAASALNPIGRDVNQILDEAMELLYPLADLGKRSSEGRAAQPIIAEALQDVTEAFEGTKKPGLHTGIANLDRRLKGMNPGDMIVIAGRPSMGKTALAMNIAENVALRDHQAGGLPVMVFSMEMSGKALSKRMMASLGGIDLSRILDGQLKDDDWDKMTVALGKLHEINMIIDETSGLTIAQIHARARREKRKWASGLGLIVIDYLQLIRPGKSVANTRNDEITLVSAGIKHMAKELGCPVIAISQLSRKAEDRADKRPLMSDLRESGAIEQDADVIMLVYRDEYYRPDSPDKGFAEVNVAKHRNGEPGMVPLIFQGEYSRFRDADQGAVAEMMQRRALEKPLKRRGGME